LRIDRSSIVVLIAVLAGCATTTEPPPVTQEPPPVASEAIPEAPAEPLPPIEDIPIAKFVIPPAFSAQAAADLEPLPMPAEDLWDRIVKGYAIPDLDGPLVEKWERWYAERPDYVARMVDRSRRYLYHIVNEVDQRSMPLEIALLPMVESAFNPVALSRARAAGIWQFIPSTGKQFGLAQTFWFDSRRDVIAATDKALEYLEQLFGRFGDWQLALASYNWGEGNVARAMQKNKARGRGEDYESLAMPNETRNYLPKLQALKNIVRDPERYGLALADVPDAPYFTVVKVDRKMDVKRAAELAELSEDEFLALNPQHNRPVIAGADDFTILLPIDRAELFAAKLELNAQPLVSWQAYRVRNGETLQQIAAKYGLQVETLRAINGIGARARIAPGHPLLVPVERPSLAADVSLEKAVFTTVPQGRTFYHRVSRGETLYAIAKRYGVTPGELREWNNLPQSSVQAGQQLRVTSDVVRMSSRQGRTRSATATGGAKPVRSGTATTQPPSAAASPAPPASPAAPERRTSSDNGGSKAGASPAVAVPASVKGSLAPVRGS
jgi:membrane-bound lytic murein transglycosylase D